MFAEDEDEAYPTGVMNPTELHSFKESRKKEWAGLMDRNTFKVADEHTIPKRTRIFAKRFVDALKTVDGRTYEKSCMVCRIFNDKDASGVPTKSLTVTRLGFRTAVSLGTMFPEYTPYLRDISQACEQSNGELGRLVYLRPLSKMGIPEGKVLQAVKPLNGIPEADLYWFITYSNHHKTELHMIPISYDLCVLYRRKEKGLEGLAVKMKPTANSYANRVSYSFPEGAKDFNGVSKSPIMVPFSESRA